MRTLLAIVLATVVGAGCIESFKRVERPRLEVYTDGRLVLDGDRVETMADVGGEEGAELLASAIRLVNMGAGALEITEMALEGEDAACFRIEADPLPAAEAPVIVPPTGQQPEPQAFELALYLSRTCPALLDGRAAEVDLVLATNRGAAGRDGFRATWVVGAPVPRLRVAPERVDFGVVPSGGTSTHELALINFGAADLSIRGMRLLGSPGFTVTLGGESWQLGEETSVLFDEPLWIGAGDSLPLAASYEAITVEQATGRIVLLTNDPTAPDGTPIPLAANAGGPCVQLTPQRVEFGGKRVGTVAEIAVDLASCGDEPLIIDEIAFAEPSSPDFSLSLPELPIVVGTNDRVSFSVLFTVSAVSPIGDDLLPIPSTGVVEVVTNTARGTLDVPVSGYGADCSSPIPIIHVQEGEEVEPQTVLHLDGTQSYGSCSSEVTKYQWSVDAPDGSVSVFLPSSAAPRPTYEANISGLYHFRLKVWDAEGTPSEEEATYDVLVISEDALHIELIWETPGDPDESDEGPEAGSDLDLHFLHPFATGEDIDGDGVADGWFDTPFDCYWFNPDADWGSLDPFVDDDATLDRDDTDGGGPENVNLHSPQDGQSYRIGVHYWNDHGWGPALATVRVYVQGVLVFEAGPRELIQCDLWEVAEVAWPSGEVTAITGPGGEPVIRSYCHPLGMGD